MLQENKQKKKKKKKKIGLGVNPAITFPQVSRLQAYAFNSHPGGCFIIHITWSLNFAHSCHFLGPGFYSETIECTIKRKLSLSLEDILSGCTEHEQLNGAQRVGSRNVKGYYLCRWPVQELGGYILKAQTTITTTPFTGPEWQNSCFENKGTGVAKLSYSHS